MLDMLDMLDKYAFPKDIFNHQRSILCVTGRETEIPSRHPRHRPSRNPQVSALAKPTSSFLLWTYPRKAFSASWSVHVLIFERVAGCIGRRRTCSTPCLAVSEHPVNARFQESLYSWGKGRSCEQKASNDVPSRLHS